MLDVAELRAGYGAMEVLRGVSLSVRAGEIVAVLGANGVGKTTLNNAISGIIRPRGGQIRFDGRELGGMAPARIVELGLVHVPEGRKIFPNLSVRENLLLGAYRRARGNRARNLDRVTALFPRLRERLAQLAGSLSGGEQQMLAIGRGLMAEPRLLILDEPSLGLSPLLVEEMFALVRRLGEAGTPVLLVEQNVVQSLAVAARAYVIEKGVVALSGVAAELARDRGLRAAYLGL